jgi:hypothetical protein
MYILDSFYSADGRCFGNILEIKILATKVVNGSITSYRFCIIGFCEQFQLFVKTGSKLDRFLGHTMFRPIWIWVDEKGIGVELSNYGRQCDKRRSSN